jgi:tetratricopeptide (TPR) repeat protein
MLNAIWDGDPGSLGAGVRAILEAGLLYERTTTTGEEEFQFKHTLVRDAAYSSLLRERRRALHQRTAQHMIELRSVNPRAASPEGIAHHLTEADNISSALEYWLQAGEASARTSSYRECEAHIREALALLERAEDREAHARSELELLVLLGPALMALYGYSATAVGEAYERARALSERTRDKPHLTPILNGLRLFDLCRHGCAPGRKSAAALMSHADALGDDASRIEGCKALGSVSVWSGKLIDASELLERGIAIYEAGENADAMRLDSDSGLTCHSFLSLARWARGDVASAIRHMETAQQIAEEARRTFGINECMCFRALLLQLMGQNDRAEATAREALNLANQHDYVLWKAMSSLVLGAAQTANGDPARGLENLSAAYRLMTEMNYIVWRPLALVELGRAFEQREDQAKALEHLSEALAVIDRTDERFWQPEAYRTRGLVFKSQGEVRSAEDSYREAIDCADSLEHRMASLRACTSLLTLTLDTGGDVSDARTMLESRLAAVGTAPDTDDIRDARVTLARSISA